MTGGSRGIGRGIALELAAEGARVAVHYYQNEAAAKDTLDHARKHGGDGLLVQADVPRPDEVRRKLAEVKTRFVRTDSGVLPNQIAATLPATGPYHVLVGEQPLIAPGERFRGAYCVSLESSAGAQATFAPHAWVE